MKRRIIKRSFQIDYHLELSSSFAFTFPSVVLILSKSKNRGEYMN